MKIVTHEHAERAMVAARGFRSPRQGRISIAGQPRHGLDGAHDAKHPSNVTLRQEHRDIGKQMRTRSDEGRAEIGIANLPFHCLA